VVTNHGRLTDDSLSPHPRKGREGNREGKKWSPIHSPHGGPLEVAATIDEHEFYVPARRSRCPWMGASS